MPVGLRLLYISLVRTPVRIENEYIVGYDSDLVIVDVPILRSSRPHLELSLSPDSVLAILFATAVLQVV
jgi:hypothetical protein